MKTGQVVAIIPARGGSKGIPGKNITPVNGKPLISYTIEQALACQLIDRVFVSTDADDISRVSKAYGAEVVTRPEGISGDFSSSEDALMHTLEVLQTQSCYVTHVVFLQCTSPIRSADDISATLNLVLSEEYDSALSVVENHKFLWRAGEAGAIPVNYDPQNRKMRQSIEEYQENGSIYVMKAEDLLASKCRLNGKVGLHVMAENSGYEIDSPLDLQIIELLMRG